MATNKETDQNQKDNSKLPKFVRIQVIVGVVALAITIIVSLMVFPLKEELDRRKRDLAGIVSEKAAEQPLPTKELSVKPTQIEPTVRPNLQTSTVTPTPKEITVTPTPYVQPSIQPPPREGWAYYGQRDGNGNWGQIYFTNETGTGQGIPKVGDRITSKSSVNLRAGYIEYDEVKGWQNKAAIGILKPNQHFEVAEVKAILDDFIWVRVKTSK